MTKEKLTNTFFLICRLTLGGLFIYASVYKIISPGAFAHQIYNYRILPSWAINPIAISLPWLELFCGMGLIIKKAEQAASICIFFMMIVFQMALGSALVRGLNVSCGCFQGGGAPASWTTFGRDFFLFLLASIQLLKSSFKENRE